MTIQTVRGPVEPSSLGFTLMHEHIKFTNHEFAHDYPELSYQPDRETALAQATRKLAMAKEAGVDTLVDCTAFFHGRDIDFVIDVNAAVDINIVVATGIYAFDYLPNVIFRRTLRSAGERDVLTRMFIRDIVHGIADTGIRAQIIKVGTDVAGVTANDERILRAAARSHCETGTTITTHSVPRLRNGLEQQRILADEGVDLTRVVIGHSGDTTDQDYLAEIMDRGSVIGCDRFGMYREGLADMAQRVATIAALCARGYSDRIVLAHDVTLHSDWNDYADLRMPVLPDWHMGHIPTDVIPALRAAGVSAGQVDQMTRQTPARLLGPGHAAGGR
jgi:phosphotriesterase-related protein